MIDIVQNKIERAVLVAVRRKDIAREVLEEHLEELRELSRTAGVEIVDMVTQDRSNKICLTQRSAAALATYHFLSEATTHCAKQCTQLFFITPLRPDLIWGL